ncbi:translation initiation factor 1 (eIF-1/SUI1) [Balneicella halophila]|uniref:Translation initiation factor 1 (eIF-1/SUI1) n=1 Tax=Balneicella halophila TaxID=1537566 RepID=A0A7L4URX9_BALHA|nr:translation initiation factor [Balneicella halophila]PVX52181.1 translation initiation factor 1 (eIF-1/SUI1) [Balneicella halophila]
MSKKKERNIVYSTNPNFQIEDEFEEETTLVPEEQHLKIVLDRKQRRGKVVTLVQGFVGSDEDLAELAKQLKRQCGVGGNAKDGEIIIQGDNKEKVHKILTDKGYSSKKV